MHWGEIDMPRKGEMSMPSSGSQQAEEIVAELAPGHARLAEVNASRVLRFFLDRIAEVDQAEVAARVGALREQYPDASSDDLAEKLIKAKCQKTAAVGAVSSSGTLLPGVGSFVAGAAGLIADLRATITLQAELVLEIAEVYRVPLQDVERQQVVMLLTGVGYGTGQLLATAGTKLTGKVAARVARNWLTRALPIIGVATSAGTNALSTYIVGQRAKAYFSHGPDAVGDWADTLRLIGGVDERKIAGWLAERGVEAQHKVGTAAASASAVFASVKSASERYAAQASGRLSHGVRRASKTIGRAGAQAWHSISSALGAAAETVKSTQSTRKKRRRK